MDLSVPTAAPAPPNPPPPMRLSMTAHDAKWALRHEAKARRAALHEELGATASLAARDVFLNMPELAAEIAAGRVAAGYWPIGSELDPRPLLNHLHERGLACTLPATVRPGAPLAFRRWTPHTELAAAGYGTMAPPPEAEALTPELILVPLLAVDARGMRLGYGAGYYDMSLRALRAGGRVVAVGLAYDGQMAEAVPADNNDERLDWLVSERRALHFAAPER